MTSDTIVGAEIAFIGVFLTQVAVIAREYLAGSKSKRAFNRDKCEYISQCIMQSEVWLNSLSLCHTYEEVRQRPIPLEARTAFSLTNIYFPNVADTAAIYYNHLLYYYNWLLSLREPNMSHPISTLADEAKSHKDYVALQGKIAKARNDFTNALSVEARKYI